MASKPKATSNGAEPQSPSPDTVERPPPTLTSTGNSRKRKADSISRQGSHIRVVTASTESKTGRGSLAGWTTCPLCGRHSKKNYAAGRGIASHLYAVHTPWKPGKVELNKRRRMLERRRAEHERPRKNGHRNTTATIETSDCTPNVHLDTWDPTQQELDAWDERVLQIVKDLETTVRQRADTDKEENINNKQKADDTETASAGFDRNGAPSLPYRSSLPPFIQAAADGNLTTLQELLQEAKAKDERAVWDLLHTRDRHLSTAEHWSAGGGHISCLRFLLELRQALLVNRSEKDTASASESLSSAPVGKKTRRRDGKTCLHYAARNGHVDCIAFLLDEQNHNIDDVSGDGTTPFHMACFGGHVKVARLLMKKGANIFATNEWGCSAAHWIGMTISKNVTDIRELCSLLRTAGVSFSEQQKQGHSALHKAAQKKNRPVIEWMAESSKQGGATLSTEETERAGRPDDGGHVPSEIWRNVGGEEAFAEYMEGEMGW